MALYIHKMVSLKWQAQKLFCLLSTVHYKVCVTNKGKKKGRKNRGTELSNMQLSLFITG